MDVPLHSLASGSTAGNAALADEVFGRKYNEALVHQVVTAYLAGMRQGSKAQKSRSDARGGGAKPWRQKGLGRARAGTIRSPIWRGGGVTFAARPRDFSQKVNRKMYRSALCSILSELQRQERLVIVDDCTVDEPRTKILAALLDKLGLTNVLLVVEEVSENLYLAARNLHWVGLVDVVSIDPAILISYDKVVMTQTAVNSLQERLK